jgi:hypothetical protein
LLFSADTVYKPSLWRQLCEEYRPQNFRSLSRDAFEKSSVIYGDINDFIERTWSRQRYVTAVNAYRDAVLIHDVARKDSIVHTDYADIADVPIRELFFTHSPDNLTSLRPILTSHRKLVLRDGRVHESVKGRLHPFDADVYVHHFSRDLVGYRAENGAYKVIGNNGLLGIAEAGGPEKELLKVDLFEDIRGEYYPLLEDTKKSYVIREDGKVEEVTRLQDSSKGRVVQDLRGTLKTENTK